MNLSNPLPVQRAFPRELRWPIVLICVAFLIGGGARADIQSLVILRPIAAIVLVVGLFGLTWRDIARHRFVSVMALAIVALSLIHVIPLPAGMVYELPGRGIIQQIDASLGTEIASRPLAMSPRFAWNAVFSLLVPLAFLVWVVRLPTDRLARLANPILALSLLSAIIGILQMVGPRGGPLYFYAITNGLDPVGLFSNRNHHALLLACTFPIAGYAASTLRGEQSSRRAALLAIYAGLVTINLFVLLGTGSRAGAVVGALGILAMILIYREGHRLAITQSKHDRTPARSAPKKRLVKWAVGALVPVVLLAVFGTSASIGRFSNPGVADEVRTRAWPVIADMVSTYWPVGSGIGSFDQVYRIAEPNAQLSYVYLNHAHNDWLEVALTAGLPGILLLAAAVAGWALGTGKLLLRHLNNKSRTNLLGLTGSAVLALIGLASVVDYPVRTPSLAVLVVLAAMWLSAATGSASKAS